MAHFSKTQDQIKAGDKTKVYRKKDTRGAMPGRPETQVGKPPAGEEPGKVTLHQQTEPFTVETAQGVRTGQPGDYVGHDHDTGDLLHVAASDLDSMFELDDRPVGPRSTQTGSGTINTKADQKSQGASVGQQHVPASEKSHTNR